MVSGDAHMDDFTEAQEAREPSEAAEGDTGDVLQDFFAEALAMEDDIVPSEPVPSAPAGTEVGMPSDHIVDPESPTPGSQPPTPVRGKKRKQAGDRPADAEEPQEELSVTERFNGVLETIKV